MLFLTLPGSMSQALERAGCVFYTWGADGGSVSARLVTSFDTAEEDVRHFLDVARTAV